MYDKNVITVRRLKFCLDIFAHPKNSVKQSFTHLLSTIMCMIQDKALLQFVQIIDHIWPSMPLPFSHRDNTPEDVGFIKNSFALKLLWATSVPLTTMVILDQEMQQNRWDNTMLCILQRTVLLFAPSVNQLPHQAPPPNHNTLLQAFIIHGRYDIAATIIDQLMPHPDINYIESLMITVIKSRFGLASKILPLITQNNYLAPSGAYPVPPYYPKIMLSAVAI